MSNFYANFDELGNCTGISQSGAELGLPHRLERYVDPSEIYLDASGKVAFRSATTLKLDRLEYLSDGIDQPDLDGRLSSGEIVAFPEGLTSTFPCHKLLVAGPSVSFSEASIRFDTLEQYKFELSQDIEALAGSERAKIITTTAGQESVYAAKRAEAVRFLADAGQVVEGQPPFNYVSSEEQATAIIERAEQCDKALAEIEGWRLDLKSQAASAESLQELMEVKEGVRRVKEANN